MNSSFVQLPMPVFLSGVILAEDAMVPLGKGNGRPPPNSVPAIRFPLSTWLWHSIQLATSARYFPYSTALPVSGWFRRSAFAGIVFTIKFTGKSREWAGGSFLTGGNVRTYAIMLCRYLPGSSLHRKLILHQRETGHLHFCSPLR